MITNIRKHSPDSFVILWGTVPVLNDPDRNKLIAEYDHVLKQIASQYDCYFLDTNKRFSAIKNKKELYLDQVHLSNKGCHLIATEMFAAIPSDYLSSKAL